VLDYLHAEVKQLASQQARVWAAMAEVHRRAIGAHAHEALWTAERVFGSAACEIACELRVSELSAQRELQRADDLQALPTVAAALRAGEMDRTRVVVLLEVCADLTAEHRDRVVAAVLPKAGRMTPGKLRAEAQRLAIALDPQWAERRYREAVRRRRVVRYINADGTVTIAAEDQDAAEALAAYARLSALAKAAKRAGAHATLDILRSKISMGLQSPRFTGMHERDIITYLVAEFPKPVAEQPGDDPLADQPAQPTATEPAHTQTVDDGLADVEPSDVEPSDVEPIDVEPIDAEPTDEPQPTDVESAEAEPAEAEPADVETVDVEPADDDPADAEPTDGPQPTDEAPSDEPPSDERLPDWPSSSDASLEEEYFEAELLAQELLDQGFFDDEECTGEQYEQLVSYALALNRSYSRRPPTDQDPDPPPF